MGLPHNGAAGWFLPDQETMAVRKTTKRLYLIPVLSKALDILELLQSENQPMTLEECRGQYAKAEAPSFRNISRQYFQGQARRDFVGEAFFFVVMVLIAAAPLLSTASALTEFCRAIAPL